MSFCNQCGQQNPDDNSFCTVCGAPLITSEVKNIPVTKTNFKIDDIISIIMGMLTKPVSTIRTVSRIEIQNFTILGGIVAVLWGILGLWLVNRIGAAIGVAAGDILGGLGGLMSMVQGNLMSEINSSIPQGTVILFSLLFSLAMILGLFLGLLTTGKFMLKSNAGSSPYFNVAVSSQVPLVTAIIIGLVFSYLSIPLGVIAIKLGAIVSTVCIFFGLQQISSAENDRVIYALPIAILIMYLIVYIFVRIYISMNM